MVNDFLRPQQRRSQPRGRCPARPDPLPGELARPLVLRCEARARGSRSGASWGGFVWRPGWARARAATGSWSGSRAAPGSWSGSRRWSKRSGFSRLYSYIRLQSASRARLWQARTRGDQCSARKKCRTNGWSAADLRASSGYERGSARRYPACRWSDVPPGDDGDARASILTNPNGLAGRFVCQAGDAPSAGSRHRCDAGRAGGIRRPWRGSSACW
jgi:hypothetical protein